MRRPFLTFVAWFVLLEGLWELLVGTFQHIEVAAGLVAAALGAAFATLLAANGLLRNEIGVPTVAATARLVWQLPVEMAVVTWVLLRELARGRRVRGEWVRIDYDGDNALAVIVGTATPNAIVVDVSRGEALLHALDARLPGGREVI